MRSTPATRAAVRARGVAEMRSCWGLSVKDPLLCPDLSAVVQASYALRATARPPKESRAKAKRRPDDEGGRDVRTQPGVLTPGCATKSIRPKGAVERALSIGDRAISSDELSTALSGRVTMWI